MEQVIKKNFEASGFYILRTRKYTLDITIPNIPICDPAMSHRLKLFDSFFFRHKNVVVLFAVLRHGNLNDTNDYSGCLAQTNLREYKNINDPKIIAYLEAIQPTYISIVPIHDEKIDFSSPSNRKLLFNYVSKKFIKPSEKNPGYDHVDFGNYVKKKFPKEELGIMDEPKVVGSGGVLRPGS